MADNQDLFAEAYAEAAKRGLIPSDLKAAAQAEAQKRGLVSKQGVVDSAFRGFDDVIRSIARGAPFATEGRSFRAKAGVGGCALSD